VLKARRALKVHRGGIKNDPEFAEDKRDFSCKCVSNSHGHIRMVGGRLPYNRRSIDQARPRQRDAAE